MKLKEDIEVSRINDTTNQENLDQEHKNNLAKILEELGKKRREERLSMEVLEEESDEEIETNFAIPRYRNMAKAIEQFVVLDSNLVTCGAGLEILSILPGYDLCQVVLHPPADSTREGIDDLLLEQGLKSCDFHIFRVERSRGQQKAIIVMDVQLGMTMAAVGFEVHHGGLLSTGTMQESQPVLTLTWDIVNEKQNDSTLALATLYDALDCSQGVLMETCCILTPDTGSSTDKVSIVVEFDSWDNVFKTADEMEKKHSKDIPSLALSLPSRYQYSIQIPRVQYLAQKNQWESLSSTKDKHKSGIHFVIGVKVVVIQIQGEDRDSVGALRVRIEKLAGGEALEGSYWHHSFASMVDSQFFFQQVTDTAEVHLRSDPDIRAVWVYGEPDNIDKARRMIRDEVHRRERIMTRTSLSEPSTEFFVRDGFGKLKELVGEDNVDLRITPKWSAITMRGGEEATHHLQRLLDESLIDNASEHPLKANAAACPICLTEVAFPEWLECGHAYCASCLIQFISAAEDSKAFPIVCVGDEAKCKVPISLPFIRRFLPHQSLKRLIEAAFATYLERNPTEFRYCKTPDCRQTYRRQTSKPVILTCPSCLAKTCSACGERHEKMTCEEYRILGDTEEQERLNNQLASKNGYKKCPSCSIWVEKTGGCNHMKCKCGAHICWTCLGIFTSSNIYDHMRTVHGH